MNFIDINNLTFNIAIDGLEDGPALVFINSLGSDYRIWDEIWPAFSSYFRVVRYDKRGHGLSDAPSGEYRLQEHIDDLDGLLTKLNLDQTVLCGVSVGGMIAQSFSVQSPQRVLGLILCDTAARIGTTELWNERIEKVTQTGIASIADSILERWFSTDFFRERPIELAGWRNMLIRTPAEGYAGTCAAIRDADLTETACKITRPALVVGGDQDGATPPDVVQTLAELIPDSRFRLIERAGHLPSIEQPEILIDCMNSFFREINVGRF